MKKFLPTPQFIIPFSLFLVALAVNISMPLFREYGKLAGLSHGELALALGSYILGMLPCYIFFGGASDVLGRKPVLLLSVLMSLSSNILITIFPNIWALIICRIFQGIALGLSMGTGTAYLTEYLDQFKKDTQAATKSANAMSLATALGFGGGAFSTTLFLLNSFTYRPFTYFIAVVATLLGCIWILGLPKIKPIGGTIMRLPYFPKNAMPINLEIAIGWACTNTVIAIIPSQLAQVGLSKYAGFGLVCINWSGALLQPFIRKHFSSKESLKIGTVLAPIGFAVVILGAKTGQIALMLLGAGMVGSSCYGFSYQGGLAAISVLGGIQRARAVSGYMLVGYIGFGVVPIFIGFLSDKIGIINALYSFEAVIVVMSLGLFQFFRKMEL